MLDILTGQIAGPLIAGVLGILGLLGAWLHGRSKGKQAEQDKRLRERLAARDKADEIEDAVAGRDPAVNRERLKRW